MLDGDQLRFNYGVWWEYDSAPIYSDISLQFVNQKKPTSKGDSA